VVERHKRPREERRLADRRISPIASLPKLVLRGVLLNSRSVRLPKPKATLDPEARGDLHPIPAKVDSETDWPIFGLRLKEEICYKKWERFSSLLCFAVVEREKSLI
jgi:hypothetical protein